MAMLAAGALVFQASYSAFSATTRNSGNAWSTASLELTDDDNGTAQFAATNLVPGQTATHCISVTASNSVAGVVKLYATNPTTSADGLENYIYLTIAAGNGGGFGSCTGFTATSTPASNVPLNTLFNDNSYATGLGSWSPPPGVAGGTSLTYQFSYTFNAGSLTQAQLDQLQGARTGVDFQWEIQNS